ncbi:MAG: hypothetical protein WCJ64_00515 [Rhodospirillaceae bacterium]
MQIVEVPNPPEDRPRDIGDFVAYAVGAPDLRDMALKAISAILHYSPADCAFFVRKTKTGYQIITANRSIPADHLQYLKVMVKPIYGSKIQLPIHHPPEVPGSVWLPLDTGPAAPALWAIFAEPQPTALADLLTIASAVHHRLVAIYGPSPRSLAQRLKLAAAI